MNKLYLKLVKHSPEILTGFGIAGMIASTILACKETSKAKEILAKTNDEFEAIKKVESDEKFKSEYSKEDSIKDKTIILTQTVVGLAKVYGPSVLLGAISIGLILKGNGILRERNSNLSVALVALKEGFEAYRKRIVEKHGSDADEDAAFYLKTEKVEETVTDEETGKSKKVKNSLIMPMGLHPFAMEFNSSCSGYNRNNDYNRLFINGVENHMNDLLVSRGYVYLHEVYDYLGAYDTTDENVRKKRLALGHTYGWVFDPNDKTRQNHVDFNAKFNWVENGETHDPIVLLEFNPDGPILDLI